MNRKEPMKKNIHLAHYFRYHWERPDLIVVTGEAEEIWNGYNAYRRRYEIPEACPEGTTMLKRLFAAAGLAAVSLAEAEWWGWSVTFPHSSTGLFCGVEPEGMVCGTVHESDPSKNIVVVQRQGKKTPMTQSHFSLITQDPVEAVERYFEESEQTLIRIAVDNQGRGALLRPMPGGNFDDISGLSDAALIDLCFGLAADGAIKRLDEFLLFYECPCDQQQISNILRTMPESQLEALWGDLESLEVFCPRCGRRYIITQ
jgi:hypothetical protein